VTVLIEAASGLGYGLASALIPLVNAEAYAVVAGRQCGHALVAVLALALGQTAGKLLLFESARRGTGWLARRFARRIRSGKAAARTARWAEPIRRWLSCRRTGLPTVFVSAAVGIPPLAVVSLAAGPAGLRRWEFAGACLFGRVIRFALFALPGILAS
jgi:membrane protein YqaA with SNARE-associated domain